MKDKIVLDTFADLLINLSAGWFIIASSAPFLPELILWEKVGLLLINFGLSIMCLTAAMWLRRRKK